MATKWVRMIRVAAASACLLAPQLSFAAEQPRTADELESAAKHAVRSSKSASSRDDRRAAARELVQVLLELEADQSLPIRTRHQAYHQVRSRLLAVEQGLRSEINRARASADWSPLADEGAKKPSQPAQINPPAIAPVLGQQLGGPAAGGAAGPALAGVPPQGRQPPDDGQRLLELIQTVIRPDTWDINGGPSSGFYYQPLHALVISAPSEVHGEVGGVLGGLRK